MSAPGTPTVKSKMLIFLHIILFNYLLVFFNGYAHFYLNPSLRKENTWAVLITSHNFQNKYSLTLQAFDVKIFPFYSKIICFNSYNNNFFNNFNGSYATNFRLKLFTCAIDIPKSPNATYYFYI